MKPNRSLCRLVLFCSLICGTINKGFAQERIEMPPGATPAIIDDFNTGNNLLAAGKASEAIDKLKQVTAKLPSFAIAHMQLGQALARVNRNDEAITELELADKLSPNNQHVMAFMGQIYQLLGRNSEALAAYRRYLKAFPQGQYAAQISLMEKTLAFEASRSGGKSSAGMDNYLSEAISGGGGGGKWDRSRMPLKIHISDGTGLDGYKAEYAQILKQAFLSWSAATANQVSFDFVDKQSAADISCRWTANLKDLINPVEGGQALVAKSNNGEIMKADILILTRNPNLPAFSETFLRHVCLHEIGHALGMAGHSSQPGDIMFAAASYESATGILSARDKKTISLLYPGTKVQTTSKQ